MLRFRILFLHQTEPFKVALNMNSLTFRETMELIDSRLLTRLVQKHNVEYVTKPLERRKLWLELTREYNTAKESNVNHARLAKRWHNMKQRARRKITVLKKKAIHENRRRGINIDKLVKNEMASELMEVALEGGNDDTNVVLVGAPIEEEKNELPTFIVQQEDKDKKKKTKKVSSPLISFSKRSRSS